uniref:hypothetical protein n=1 Tax=Bacteroides ovatus TaxID=28116 RepID=UPI004026F0EE
LSTAITLLEGVLKKRIMLYIYDFTIYDFTIEVPAGETLLFFCGAKIINFVGGRKKIENKFPIPYLICLFFDVRFTYYRYI